MGLRSWKAAVIVVTLVATGGAAVVARGGFGDQDEDRRFGGRKARNAIFFIGDGMGVSTVTATRVFSVGVDGQLVVDQFPHTALSKTYSADSITPDSAPTMSAMMTGVNTNQSVIGLDASTEPSDFNGDGDGAAPWTVLELAKQRLIALACLTRSSGITMDQGIEGRRA